MKESVKKFMEVVSSEGNDTIEKLQNADAETIISMALERGITIEADDLMQEDELTEMSMDELAATTGGKRCVCPAVGGGLEDSHHYACACVVGGGGRAKPGYSFSYVNACLCVIGGNGGKEDGTYPDDPD